MAEIKARPTTYKGTLMRSRLEADYAAELDRWGYRWEYEPECFASSEGQWLPDFCRSYGSRPLEVFIEVKPVEPLLKWVPGSGGFVEHVDAILRRMMIARASRPGVPLELVFWRYGGPAYLRLLSRGSTWTAEAGDAEIPLIWPGMGLTERLRDDEPLEVS